MAKRAPKSAALAASLKTKQQKAIVMLARGATFAATTKALGISLRTLYDWRQSEPFARALRELQTDILAGAIGILKSKSQSAARTLARAARVGDVGSCARVPGARAVLDFAFKGVEFEVLDERIRKLEEAQSPSL